MKSIELVTILILALLFPLSIHGQENNGSADISVIQQRESPSFSLSWLMGVGITTGNAFEEGIEKTIEDGRNLTLGFQLMFHPRYGSKGQLAFGLDGGASFDVTKRTVWGSEAFIVWMGSDKWIPMDGKYFRQHLITLIPIIQLGNPDGGYYFQGGVGIHASWWNTNLHGISEMKAHYWQRGPSFSVAVGFYQFLLKFQAHDTYAEHEFLWAADRRTLTLSVRF